MMLEHLAGRIVVETVEAVFLLAHFPAAESAREDERLGLGAGGHAFREALELRARRPRVKCALRPFVYASRSAAEPAIEKARTHRSISNTSPTPSATAQPVARL